MVLRAVERDAQVVGDLFIGVVAPQQREHFALSLSQIVGNMPAHCESIFAPLGRLGTTRRSA